MTIDIPYEAVEYGKVLLGYIFMMFLAPSVVFYRHLRNKSLLYRFGFCVTAVPVCLNALVLVLGLFHILDTRLTALILWGVFGASAARLIWEFRRELPAWRRRFSLRLPKSLLRKDGVYLGLWAVTLLFGAVYFTYGAFQVSCYGYGDLYVHHSWIYGLMEGNVYSGGIYPEAMHCVVYCMRAFLGISVFSCLRFFQCVHVVVYLVSAGCLLREIFRWRYTPVLTLVLFLTLNVRGAEMITPMSRLQWTMPMEFGLPAVFLCVLFLMRYVKGTPEDAGETNGKGYWRDENLLVFMLAVTVTLVTHFYTTIMAFLLCVPVALCACRKVFHWKRLLPLVTAAVCSLVIALAPIGWALAKGMPFEGSINWALSSMSGDSAREDRERLEAREVQEAESSAAVTAQRTAAAEAPERDETPGGAETDGLREDAVSLRAEALKEGAGEEAKAPDGGGVFRFGYAKLYGEGRGALLLGLTCLALALCLAGKIRKCKWAGGVGYGYVPMALMSVVFVVTYAMPYMGLPQIIAEGRFSAAGHPLTLAAALIPLDIAGSLAAERWGEKLLGKLAVAAAIGIYVLVRLTGNYHGFLYYELSRYPEAVTVTREIMESLTPHTYAITSTTDELYQVVEQGTHVELQTFLENVEQEEYYLWMPHVFFFVEKKPLYYAQLYFAEGPSWLGEERYPDESREEYETVHPTWRVSQAPGVIASEISPDKTEREITESNAWLRYTMLENREVLESRAYEQCMRLMETYPGQMDVYFEDENFICFHLRQDRKNPCNLAIPREQQGPPAEG